MRRDTQYAALVLAAWGPSVERSLPAAMVLARPPDQQRLVPVGGNSHCARLTHGI